jgi:hypothetical protein
MTTLNPLSSVDKFVLPCERIARTDLMVTSTDVDYLLYSGTASKLFGDGDDPFLSGLTGNSFIILGVMKSETLLKKVKSQNFQSVAVFCTVGNTFHLGVPNSEKGRKSISTREFDLSLQKLWLRNIRPFSEICDFLVQNYSNKEIVVYAFGQKAPVNIGLRSQLLRVLEKVGTLEVGLAQQLYGPDGFYVALKNTPKLGFEAFPAFHSDEACNLQTNNATTSNQVIRGKFNNK